MQSHEGEGWLASPPMTRADRERCPCGGASYDTCCGPVHAGTARPARAVQVMRARYSAFAKGDASYLLRSWHPDTRPLRVRFEPGLRWIRLEILDTADGDLLDAEGAVEFDAHHERNGTRQVLHERSLFLRSDGAWVYVGPVAAHLA